MAVVWNVRFWKQAAERCIKSAAQGFLTGAGIGSTVGDFAVLSLDGLAAGGAGAASMALLSLLTSVASSSVSPEGTPSLVE